MALPLLLVGAGAVGLGLAVRARRQAEAGELAPGPADAGAAPSLVLLRQEIDRAWPNRLRTSDGLLPSDSAEEKSAHGQGLAIDVTYDPARGPNLDALADRLLADPRVAYVIWNNRVAEKPGAWHPYCVGQTACSPHTRHLHLSIVPEARDDVRPWNLGSIKSQITKTPGGLAGSLKSPTEFKDSDLVGHYLRDAWFAGLVDNVEWISISPTVQIAAEPLSVQGVRIPASYNDALEILASVGATLPTKAIADAAFEKASRRLTPKPLSADGSMQTWGKVRQWNTKIGPVGTDLAAGAWKHWIQTPEGGPVNYGLWKPDGSIWQTPGHQHGPDYYDETQLLQPARLR